MRVITSRNVYHACIGTSKCIYSLPRNPEQNLPGAASPTGLMKVNRDSTTILQIYILEVIPSPGHQVGDLSIETLKTQQEKGKTAIYLKGQFINDIVQDCDYVHWKLEKENQEQLYFWASRVQCPPAVSSSKSGQDFGHSA